MGQASPYEVIPSQNEIDVFMNTKNCSHGGFPKNLTFTYTNYIYTKLYCGHPAASANGTADEDKGRSLSDGMMFGSVGGGTTLASDLVSTPSAG